jgi:parallel beta-helix repeat protein
MAFLAEKNFGYFNKWVIRMPFKAIQCFCHPAFLSLLLVLLLASYPITATTHIVSERTDDYSIQGAINKAKEGDRIIVKSGTYPERLNITKKVIIIGVDTGGGLPVVDANERKSAITLYVDGIWLEGLSVVNSGNSWQDAGIKIFSNSNYIYRNILNKNSYGISLWNSSNNRIRSNLAIGNDVGIALQSSDNNTIQDNLAANNSFAGFFLGSSRNNTIRNNRGQANSWVGFLFNDTDNNTIQGNIAQGNANAGIWLLNSRGNQIINNNASNGPIFGFVLDASSNNTISENTAFKNLDGISMDRSSRNTIKCNNISSNVFGIYLDSSNTNVIYLNNFIENIMNVYSYNSSNRWISEKSINYLYKGMMRYAANIGNFWSDDRGVDEYESGIAKSGYNSEFVMDKSPLVSRKEFYQILG